MRRTDPRVNASVNTPTLDGYPAARAELLARPGSPGPGRRQALVSLTDDWLAGIFTAAVGERTDLALVAIGGYGRAELAPGSDVDLLLLHRGGDVADIADRIWYPVWDAGLQLDHSVRTPPQARRLAADELTVLLGLLDARAVAGDAALVESLRASVLADWRAFAAKRLAALHEIVVQRTDRHGELAHLLEPDLKESYGGLRDLTVLRALAASWVADVPHGSLTAARATLLDIRDGLHRSTGRRADRLLLQEQDPVADLLGHPDADDLLRSVSTAGRAIAYASDATWHRALRATATRRGPVRRLRGRLTTSRAPLADGVVAQDGEVVLAEQARPDRDPVLVLRAAAAAAQAGLRLAPHTVTRLAEASVPMPVPWPREAREALVSLLGAGRATVAVWEALDQVGVITRLLPWWSHVRSTPQRNPVHRFTVDRHLVETAVYASDYTRTVARPDLLLVGSLLHDIGKGLPGDHTDVGMRIVAEAAPHLGFDADDSAVLVSLVRYHLLLPDTATRRDLDDPATVATVAAAVQTGEVLDLLHALTRADAAATGPAAWSDWKGALIADLVNRTRAALQGSPPPQPPELTPEQEAWAAGSGVRVSVAEPVADIPGAPGPVRTISVTVAAPDRRGLLATVAGVLSLHRLDVRAAHIRTIGTRAVSVWTAEPAYGSAPRPDALRDDVRRALEGSLDVPGRLAKRARDAAPRSTHGSPPPVVCLVEGASARATVLEVRAHDAPGLLHRLTNALTAAGADITAARVATLGSEVVDVFYLQAPAGGPLDADAAEAIAVAVRRAVEAGDVIEQTED